MVVVEGVAREGGGGGALALALLQAHMGVDLVVVAPRAPPHRRAIRRNQSRS